MPFPSVPSARTARLLSGATLLATVLLPGCGPEFFKARGTVSSDGGPLKAWSRTPVLCSRGGEQAGDPGKLLTLRFDLPPGFQASHPNGRNAPEELSFAENGAGIMGSLKVFAEVKAPGAPDTMHQAFTGFSLDNANCKTLKLDREEQSKDFAESTRPLKGHLQLDCNVEGSHITSDISFKHCTF